MAPAALNSCVVIGTTVAVLIVVFHPRVVNSVTWRATVTPLASIIGSGFLVLGPIMKHSFGPSGILVMLMLCVGAYLIGGAIRFNIARYGFYHAAERHRADHRVAPRERFRPTCWWRPTGFQSPTT